MIDTLMATMELDEAQLESSTQIFKSYEQAADAASKVHCGDGFVTKVQRSRYGKGFVIRKVPVTALLHGGFSRALFRPLKYEDL